MCCDHRENQDRRIVVEDAEDGHDDGVDDGCVCDGRFLDGEMIVLDVHDDCDASDNNAY